MLSLAGKRYSSSKKSKANLQIKKQSIFNQLALRQDKPKQKKVNSFDTISRQIKNSFIIRMTKDCNTEVTCAPRYNAIFKSNKRPTIDHASFTRIIGDVKPQEYSVQMSILSQKCLKSHSNPQRQILTTKETHNWRKTTYDFSKQISTKRLELPKKLQTQQSTNDNFMETLKCITESNFNNYQRFKLKPKNKKSHSFNLTTYNNRFHSSTDNSSQNYLTQINQHDQHQKCVAQTNEGFVRRAMGKPKCEARFYMFKEKIATRFDRMDRDWNCHLDYDIKVTKPCNSIVDISKLSDRKDNDIFSKYPMRISLCHHLKIRP